MTVRNLPLVVPGGSLSVSFGPAGSGFAYALSSSPYETTVRVFTPPISLGSLGAKTVECSLSVDAQPDRAVSFSYSYRFAPPRFESVSPMTVRSDAGGYITAKILFLPFPARIGATIGGNPIPLSFITVSDTSSLRCTELTIRLPDAPPGNQTLSVFPRGEGMEGGRGASVELVVLDR